MYERFKNRPLSHSQLSSFEYDPEQWYQSYVLGIRTPASPEMLIGTKIGDAIGTEDNPIPDLNPPGVKEYKMSAEWEGIKMVGYADHYCPDMVELHENKTSHNKKRWTKGKVDKHKQLTMYAFMLNLTDGVSPEDITMYLNFIPVDLVGIGYVANPNWRQFETRRTMSDIEEYKVYITDTIKAMDDYASKRKLSTPPRPAPCYTN